eukprot:TRINITY_DN1623_c0_g1_i1.p2 TRINITY_DN1623_c0_g1~~TRINITY_DN1623_c0_g1_i1.p2  ORF type:complete len:441 (+),score=25.75 TRINITY_DN1623_c0_g1_i1:62-1384(+)
MHYVNKQPRHNKKQWVYILLTQKLVLVSPTCQLIGMPFNIFVFYFIICQLVVGERQEWSVTREEVPNLKLTGSGIKIAYFVLISSQESDCAIRLIKRILDKQNFYALHFDAKIKDEEIEPVFPQLVQLNSSYGNIRFIPRQQISYAGITLVHAELTAMAFMLENFSEWDYFINLSPSDYPLLTQSAIRAVLSQAPKGVSFISNWVAECWNVNRRGMPLYYDSALQGSLSGLLPLKIARSNPNATTQIYKGSQWHILSREFIQSVISSTDGNARRWLLYFSNFYIPDESYFQTLVCNSPNLKWRVLNEDWRYIDWTNSRMRQQRPRDSIDMGPVIIDNEQYLLEALTSSALFARKFPQQCSNGIRDIVDQFIDEGRVELLETWWWKQRGVVVEQKDLFTNAMKRMKELINNGQGCAKSTAYRFRSGKSCELWQRALKQLFG